MRALKVSEILSAAIGEAIERAAASNLTILPNLPPTLPDVQADPDGLLRALRALLDNAIKFSPGGGQIRIDVAADDDYLTIAFVDPGVGIDPGFLPHIFDRFQHQERRGEHLFGGIGLGLSIARHLIESYGGTINVESQVDQGSVFTVRLPVLVKSQPSSVSGSSTPGDQLV